MSNKLTLAEKLQSVSTPWAPDSIQKWDFPCEMLRLYEENDVQGMVTLFEAYRHFILKGNTTETEAQKVSRAQRNLDIASIAANLMIEGHDMVEAMDKASKELDSSLLVDVRKFYHDSIGYKP